MKKLNLKQLLSVSLTLFAIFFGAGNMIFPPAMGQLAGDNFLAALAGFILTDAGIAILGMIAVVLVGSSMSDLGSLVSKKFALCLSVGIYLLIGPLFAMPRTGSASFELTLLPYIPQEYTWVFSLLFTGCFFALTYYLSSNPSKVVDVVGQYMTPILLLSILVIFLGCLFTEPVDTAAISYGTLGAPQQDYSSIPFFKGMMEGYLALDGPAGLAFAIIVINALKGYGVQDKKGIVKYSVFCGIGAALFLSVVYFMLSYAGAITATSFSNGGALLHALTTSLFGPVGGLILGLAVLMACLTTSIGLTTSFADYFTELLPSVSYKKIAAAVCLFSFVISNVGLSQLIRQQPHTYPNQSRDHPAQPQSVQGQIFFRPLGEHEGNPGGVQSVDEGGEKRHHHTAHIHHASVCDVGFKEGQHDQHHAHGVDHHQNGQREPVWPLNYQKS